MDSLWEPCTSASDWGELSLPGLFLVAWEALLQVLSHAEHGFQCLGVAASATDGVGACANYSVQLRRVLIRKKFSHGWTVCRRKGPHPWVRLTGGGFFLKTVCTRTRAGTGDTPPPLHGTPAYGCFGLFTSHGPTNTASFFSVRVSAC